MPLYDFACGECGRRFERLVRREPQITTLECPDCGGTQVNRELSLPAAPVSTTQAMPMACGSGPPCGASWCQRKG